jgi:hypothetical protein
MKILYLLLVSFFSLTHLFAQQVTTTFGKNRLQFNQDFREWLQYESPNFIAYWYGPARNVGQAAIQFAEYDVKDVQSILEHQLSGKIEIIIYTDLTDLKQTNFGEEDLFGMNMSEHELSDLDLISPHRAYLNKNTGNQVGRAINNKIFVYFDGNHQHLRKQVREGIATIYLNSMLNGGNLQEAVQSALSYSLPNWYQLGIVSYAANEWDVHKDNVLKEVILSPKFKNFKRFAQENPTLAGHAFWYYISQTYGKQNLSNLLYLTRINHNIESGFQYVLGANPNKIFDSWYSFFKDRYTNDKQTRTPLAGEIAIKNKGRFPVSSAKMSPDGKYLAYVLNEVGRSRIFVQDLATGKKNRILKVGFYNNTQTTDYAYPSIAWRPNGYELSVIYERKDVIRLFTYDLKLKKAKTEPMLAEFQRVYNADYLSNNELALSASTNGFSDIFIYKVIGRNFERITNDFYDDLDVAAVKLRNHRGLVWASNRPDTLLASNKIDSIFPLGNFDIFYMDLEKRTTNLMQLSQTSQFNERNPIGIDTTFFAYLSEQNGIVNRNVAKIKEVFDHTRTTIIFKDAARQVLEKDFSPTEKDLLLIDTLWRTPVYRTIGEGHLQTNVEKNLLSHHAAAKNNQWSSVMYSDKKFRVMVSPIDTTTRLSPINTAFRQFSILRQRRLSMVKDSSAGEFANKTNGQDVEATIATTIDADTLKKTNTVEKIIVQDNPYDDYFQSLFPNVKDKNKPTNEQVFTFVEAETPKNKLLFSEGRKVEFPIHQFKGTRVTPYRLKFRTDDVSFLKFDNTPIVNNSEIFAGGFSSQATGLLSKITFKDLLEDYKIEVGVRFSLFIGGRFNAFNNTNSTILGSNPNTTPNTTYGTREYYTTFWTKKKKIDKKYTYYRRVNNYSDAYFNEVQKSKLISDIGEVEFRFPIDIYSSLRLTSSLRLDKLLYLATDLKALQAPARNEQRVSLKAEYIFDNTLPVGQNLWYGARAKFFAESIKGLRVDVAENPTFNFKNGFMSVVGFDARYYQRLDRRSILAIRTAAATSFGVEKTLYILGGMEGGLRLPTPNGLSLPAGNFAFIQPAFQMRGFGQNIRNGNTFALINTELRVPISQYIFPNARANWLKNLQTIAFFDSGTAWHGKKLFSTDNPLNTVYVPDNPDSPIRLKVNYFRDPIVLAYGFGVRTTLLGYFMKVDYAYGIETRVVQKPIWHLSLGTDF